MNYWVRHTLSFLLVFCMMLCFPVSAAEEDDLLSHYNGNEKDYCNYLTNVFAKLYPYTWDSYSDDLIGPEMVRLFDAYYTDIHHPYLSGKIDEETGEVTITGLRPAGYITPYSLTDEPAYQWIYMRVDEIVIPNEIDGHPVTRIMRDAFSSRKKIEYGETRYVSTTKKF